MLPKAGMGRQRGRSDDAEGAAPTRVGPNGPLRPLGPEIVLHRQRQRLSQVALAQRLGVRQQTVSRWERAGAVPPPARVIDIEDVFGLDRGTLLRAAGFVSAAPDEAQMALPRVLSALHDLSDDDLIAVIDSAWQIHRQRLQPPTTPQTLPRKGRRRPKR